jgi:hypothetical protein
MPSKVKELSWANVNLDDSKEREAFRRQEQHKAGVRIKKAVRDLQERGILDERGRRIRKELPPDMREGSKCGL